MKPEIFCLFALFSQSFSLPNPKQTLPSPVGDKRYGITGGKTADIKRYPYVVSMMNDAEDLVLGSGAILDKNWILCSAFQVSDTSLAEEISVRAGSNRADAGGQHLNVSKIITHEQFNGSFAYNIALVKTSDAIKLSRTVRTIRLAKSTPRSGLKSTVIGYGMNLKGPQISSGRLRTAKTRVSSQDVCTAQFGDLGDTCFCADSGAESAPCFNDLGDPLVHNGRLLGVYIGGDVCNNYNQTELYANVAPLRDWILTKIKEDPDARPLYVDKAGNGEDVDAVDADIDVDNNRSHGLEADDIDQH